MSAILFMSTRPAVKEPMTGLTNKQLTIAKKAKKDEFYTTRQVIEDELIHYKNDFKGRPVLCNCNDWPERSEFVRFFMRHMHDWNIPRLIAVGYREDADTLLGNGTGIRYELRNDGRDTEYTMEDFTVTTLAGTGGFETPECEQLLDIPDIIVCTNPPFGKFRQYLPLLAKHDVEFLIIGNLNAVTYKEIFPLFKTEQCWLGVSIHSGDRPFNVPDDYPLEAATHGYDENGRPYIRVNTVRWFTNLPGGLSDKNRPATTGRHYTGHEQDYPEYDDYPAINVDRVSDIPDDYMGAMGVPVTVLDGWGPSRLGNGFRLLGVLNQYMKGLDWGPLYERFHRAVLDPEGLKHRIQQLLDDDEVTRKPGIWEYVLDDNPTHLSLRQFDRKTARAQYDRQTTWAREHELSNCPLCREPDGDDKERIWEFQQMEADHRKPWSKGGKTVPDNCEMLCKKHNRAKSNL